ncbi:hypothetical protein [Pseudomonas sp. 28 E 9]|nr:hypothetical protein [Pseudomonas sp. 28 E 9]
MTTVVGIPDPRQLSPLVVAVIRRVAVRIKFADDIALLITLVFPDRLTTPYNPYETVVMLVGRRLILTRKQRDQASGVVVLIRRHRAQRVLLDGQSALVVVGFEMPGTVGIDALYQSRPVVMHVHFLAAIGVVHVDAAVIAPYIARVHLRKTGPVPDTARGFTRPFPFPKETRPTGQLPLKNDVLIVVPISLAFTDGIGCRHQSSGGVVGVGNDVLLGHPHEGFMAFGAMHLVVHRHNPTQRVAQEQRAPRAVIQSLNTPQPIPDNAQPVVIRIADRGQHTVLKVIKPERLRQHQLVRRRAQINRRFRQAVGNRRPSSRRQGQGGRAILMVGPHHRIG